MFLIIYHDCFRIEITPFINQRGNTSYMLDVFDMSRGGSFAYCFIRYQWRGGTNYYMWSACDGWVFPCPVRIKDLLHGFNWSYVRRTFANGSYSICSGTLPF